MKFFYAVCSWICLSGFGISATDGTDLNGREGGNVTVTCTHTWASTNRKYFCRDPCNDMKDVLVSSDWSPRGRFSLKTVPGNGKFTVTITDLKESDSGIYWCGVDRAGADTYLWVALKVSKAADTHTTQRTPTPETKPEPQTSTSRSFNPAPDDITYSITVKGPVLPNTPEDQTFFDKTGLLVCTAVGLTVMLLIFGVILYVYKKKKRKSHSSSGTTACDAERPTTITTETACDYEDITETQHWADPHTPTTVYSAVNHRSAANQIEDSSLYSNLPIQQSCSDQTIDMVIYATTDLRKKQGQQTFRPEDTVTYDTVFCS
ncbi:hypothetical protein E1301_Tti022592 [Triplophysa tibetana]|uniref:Ig-like domain-containing protein n=1 Tax=Triplophysa tibetana TaxID=1572043 RepID=A0A5A9PIT5_9TELE|nr:hypothetical protein E1301_Tti022592 [Triplophysa tibetana]